MKYTLFVHDLSSNPIVRAYPFACALKDKGCEIEILGFLIGDNEIYEPFRDMFDFKVIRSSGYTLDILRKSFKLAKMASGDLCISFKPLITTFFPALLYSKLFNRNAKLHLDIEDNDVWGRWVGKSWTYRQHIWELTGCVGFYPNVLLHIVAKYTNSVTVSTKMLTGIYGGKVLRNPPVTEYSKEYVPIGGVEQFNLRVRHNLPLKGVLLFFMGKSNPHKGLIEFIESGYFPRNNADFFLVLVGDPRQSDFIQAKEILGEQCFLIGVLPNVLIPEIVTACDVGVVFQKNSEYSKYQLPAKLIESLSCGRPVVTRSFGDIPLIICDEIKSAGWMIDTNSDELEWKDILSRKSKIDELNILLNSKGEFAKNIYNLYFSYMLFKSKLLVQIN
jgi:glycosyltransferase involved in cell wall biosynthesis